MRTGSVAAGETSLRAGRPDRITTGLADERPGGLGRQGIEDDFERFCVRHTALTLTVQKFGLNSPGFSFCEKVHSARGLHATIVETSRNCPNTGRG